LDDITALLATCQQKTFHGDRDMTIILALMDTGTRAQEFLDMNLEDVDLITGATWIRQGKGSKPRTDYLGKKSRKALSKNPFPALIQALLRPLNASCRC
jgi:site-specific recombinase XerD